MSKSYFFSAQAAKGSRRRKDLTPLERREQEKASRFLPGYMTPAVLVSRSRQRHRSRNTHPGKRGVR